MWGWYRRWQEHRARVRLQDMDALMTRVINDLGVLRVNLVVLYGEVGLSIADIDRLAAHAELSRSLVDKARGATQSAHDVPTLASVTFDMQRRQRDMIIE